MEKLETLRNRVIDQLLAINDPRYLEALSQMIGHSKVEESSVRLSEEQKLMLAMSDEDIRSERLIDQNELNEQELTWLNEK
jgi:hypothetical protein